MDKDTEEDIAKVLIIILISCLVFFTIKFMLSWHTLDTVHNYQVIAAEVNNQGPFTNQNGSRLMFPTINEITDVGSDYNSYTLQNYFISAMNGLKKYFILSVITSLLLGYFLNYRSGNGTRNRKKVERN